MAKIAVVGPGAIGGVMAAWLGGVAGHEVILCSRRPLAQLTVETPGRTIELHPEVLTDPRQARPVDWILAAMKAYDADAAAGWFPGLGASGAPVAILQNGVEHCARFAGRVSPERLLPVVVECPAERDTPTHIRQRRNADLIVPDTALGRSFAALFEGTAIAVARTADFTSVAWKKLCFNAAGIIPALVLKPAGVMRDEAVGEAARALIRECIAVGRAEGAVLADELADTIVQRYRNSPPDSLNSLHADRLAGRPMESDARNGVIVRLGAKHGIPTPCNAMAVALLAAAAAKSGS